MRGAILVAGLVLFGVSAVPLAMMGREVATAWSVERTLEVRGIHDSLAVFVGSHEVRIEDDLPPSDDPEARAVTPVRIVVDGDDRGIPFEVLARPHYHDASRYHGALSLQRWRDRRTGEAVVVIGQALGAPRSARGIDEARGRFRVLTVDGAGRVREDVFRYDRRGDPPTRTVAIASLAGHPIGYHSDLMQVWPSLLYPILYPLGTGAAGLLLLLLARFLGPGRRVVWGSPRR